MVAVGNIVEVLGIGRVRGKVVRSLGDLERAIESGLPKSTLDHTLKTIMGDRRDISQYRDHVIPSATYKRRKATLSSEESQRVERLARVIATAFLVWNDVELVRQFLLSPHSLLEDRNPLDVAATDLGARRVEDLLWGLVYGLPV